MHNRCVYRKLLLVLGASAVVSTEALADVTNFARRIGEATLNRHQWVEEGGSQGQPYSSWASASYTSLDSVDDERRGSRFHGDLWQMVVGVDRRWDNWLAGVSLSYAQRENDFTLTTDPEEAAGSVFRRETSYYQPGVAGYLAYRFSDDFYANAIVGFEHWRIETGDASPTIQLQVPFSDLSLNVVKHWGAWVVKGRVGHRFEYAVCDHERCFGDDSYQNTLYGFAEAGYEFGRWLPFVRARIEDHISGFGGDRQDYYLGFGVQYRFNNAVDLALVYERELQEDLLESNQVMLNVAVRF